MLPSSTILIIDDNPDHRFITERLLRQAGVSNRVISVSGADAAIAYLSAAHESPEAATTLVLLDLHMPGTNGFEFLAWAQQQSWRQKTKIILLTSDNQPEVREQAMVAGADAFWIKHPPAEQFADLIAMIESAVSAEKTNQDQSHGS